MVVPVPDIFPGLIVHIPVAGRPFNTMLPVVATHEEGWVITTLADSTDIHPGSLVTLKL